MVARLEEIENVYRSRYAAFVRVATAIVGDEQLARRCRARRFRSGGQAPAAVAGEAPLEVWIWRIVVNEARKQRRLTYEVLVDEGAAPAASENGGGDSVRVLVAALPERQRLVLFLRYYADLDYHSIAEALGIAVGTVGAALSAAHTSLRRQLQEVER